LNIGHVATNAQDHPITPVIIDSLTLLGLEIGDFSPVDTAQAVITNASLQFGVNAYDVNNFEEADFQWFVNDVQQNEAIQSTFNYTFSQNGDYYIKCLTSNPEISYPIIWHVTVSPSSNDITQISAPALNITSAYPNPFNNFVNVKFTSSINEPVTMNIYDIKGHLIKTEKTRFSNNFNNTLSWNGKNNLNLPVANGIYFVEIKNSKTKAVSKILHIK